MPPETKKKGPPKARQLIKIADLHVGDEIIESGPRGKTKRTKVYTIRPDLVDHHEVVVNGDARYFTGAEVVVLR